MLARITQFIKSRDPDIVGLLEIDTGSIRTGMVNQAESVARSLGHYSSYQCKIRQRPRSTSWCRSCASRASAFWQRRACTASAYTISTFRHQAPDHRTGARAGRSVPGALVAEIPPPPVPAPLLHELVEKSTKPLIVAGDFNTFWGEHEIYLFMRASGLRSANANSSPSFPSRSPRKELDFILYSDGIRVTHFEVADVRLSDHRPLICDFEVTGLAGASDRLKVG